MSLDIHPRAQAEIREAADWYDERRPGLGDEFLALVESTLELIERYPRRYGTVPDAPPTREVRRRILQRFPYSVVYEMRGEDVFVLAVAHARRQSGYWLDRNGGTP